MSHGRTNALLAVLLTASPPAPLTAQGDARPPGFTPASASSQRDFEARLLAVADTANTRRMSQVLSRVPHVAGRPEQAATRDDVIAEMKSWGLESWTKEYTVYLPWPDTVAAWVLPRPGAVAQPLSLREPPLGANPGTLMPQVPAFNAYTGDGDVTAEVVYVNYGLIDDYKTLDSLGISVRGKIPIARYGRSFRGIKAREAEKRGAVALILYSDPQDDGYVRGDVYPKGPMRPAGGIQRGSVMNDNGDPTTPGYASLPGVRRLSEDSLPIPRIPVIPIGYGNARRMLEPLAGPSVPQPWQGALPFRYHVGPGPVRARLKVRTERGARAMHKIWNTFGMVRGARHPDEWIIVGAHRDAWSPGARDNISGTVTVLEAARAFAALARQGIRPARTLIFATWDAEEWGLIGSTEWVEEMEDSLRAHAVAYINEDGTFSGRDFSGDASPSLKTLIREAARSVPDPAGTGSVYETWLRKNKGDSAALLLENLGGGSDFAGFYHHLGIPAGGIGFDGPNGIYHSMYDSYDWMSRFGDPGYRAQQAGARLVSLIVARLANADIVPLDYAAFGTELTRLVAQLDSAIAAQPWDMGKGTGAGGGNGGNGGGGGGGGGGRGTSTQGLKDALSRFTEAARRFAATRDSTLDATGATGTSGTAGDRARYARANAALMQVERRLTRPEGLVSRPWYRSLQFASDLDNGYATMAFPSVNEAIRYANAAAIERELADLAARVDHARAALDEASAALH